MKHLMICIECELIVTFQLQLKGLTHVISQKTSRQVFKKTNISVLKTFVKNLLSFEK
jgi:hypothetical protein